MPNEQSIKEHKAPYAIVIHILQGKIDFGVQGVYHAMKTGDIISLEKNIPHDLIAKENSIIRLTLCKHDKLERVV